MRSITVPPLVQVGGENVPFWQVLEAALNAPEWRASIGALSEAIELLQRAKRVAPGDELQIDEQAALRLARWARRPSYDTPGGPQPGFPWPAPVARALLPHLRVLEGLATEAECFGAPGAGSAPFAPR